MSAAANMPRKYWLRPVPGNACCGFVGVTLLLISVMSPAAAPPDEPAVIAFVDVSIVRPEFNRVDAAQTVIVSGTTISRLGAAATVAVPHNAQRITGAGRYLLAGLAEMHAHVPKAAQGRDYLEDMLFLWIANGITTIRNMNGEPAHLELREQILRQEVAGPRMYTAGPPFQGAKIKTADEVGEIVAAQIGAGYDFVKVHMALPLPIYEAVAAAANARQFPFAGHVAESAGLARALKARQASIDHLDAYLPALVSADIHIAGLEYGLLGMPYTPYVDIAMLAEVAHATKGAGVWNVPTLTLAENFVGPFDPDAVLPGMEYMPPRMVRSWGGIVQGFQKTLADPQMAQQFLQLRKQLVLALHTAGAGLLLGSDAPQVLNVPGFATHNELALMVDAGLTPAEALTAATVNAAVFLAAADRFGRIDAGLDADLVLLDANPLDELDTLRTPAGVMLRGRWMSADDLAVGLEHIAAKNRQ